jgi:quercetin dioxygenase-like cupin family protein
MNTPLNLIGLAIAALIAFRAEPAIAQAVPAAVESTRALVLRKGDLMAKAPDRSGPGVKVWTMRRHGSARTNMVEFSARGPLHTHPDADHTLMVLEGAVWVVAGPDTFKLTAGDYVSIPPNMPHTYWVDPGEKALLVSFDAPAYDESKTVFLEPRK